MTPGPTVPLIAISFRPVSFRLVLFLLCSVLYIGSFIRIVVYIQHHGHGHSPPSDSTSASMAISLFLSTWRIPFFVFIRVDVARNASIHRGSFVFGVQKLCDQECSGVSGLHVEPCDTCVLRLLNSALVSSLAPVGPQARAPKSDQPSKETKGACRSKRHCYQWTTTSNKRNLDAYWY